MSPVGGSRFDQWEIGGRTAPTLWRRLTPPQLFIASFLALIFLGTVGLMVLPGLYTGPGLNWLDALFTATSAVCVTGLIVVDTATYFTPWGQAFILLLIQLGGLGIVTFTTLIILVLGRRLSLRHETLAAAEAEVAEEIDHRRLAWAIIRYTLVFELVGAVILYLVWGSKLGWDAAAWHAVFQSVSAFSNAGFSTFSDSLMGFDGSVPTLLVMAALIVVGGVGFLVLEEIHLWGRGRGDGRGARLSLHSRLVLTATAVLLVGGWGAYGLFEWSGVLEGLGTADRIANALFMSVTARTAGFNSVDYASAANDTNFLTILLMAVGGSPGSTAGGLKTTTVALIGLLAVARLRGDEIVSVWGRSVPEETIQRAVGLFVLGFTVITLALFGYAHTELDALQRNVQPFFIHMFEAVSAFNTVGLSLGATPELSAGGRWLTIFLMYVGRVGPLVFASALAQRAYSTKSIRYSYEDVVIG